MKNIWITGLLIFIVLISGCTSGTNTPPPSQTQVQQTTSPPQTSTPQKQTNSQAPLKATVQNIDFSFYPSELIIARGGTVTWAQKDYEQHTVTGEKFDLGPVSQGRTFSYTFDEAGTFEYRCKNHPTMKGKIIVI